MDKIPFFHALKIDEDTCIGCSRCMKICPTEALRVRDGKAVLIPDRCVDCGNCFKVCPTRSIFVEQDDFEAIFNFPVRVALVPAVFMGQFPNDITVSRIYCILKELGFTHIIEAARTSSRRNHPYLFTRRPKRNTPPKIPTSNR